MYDLQELYTQVNRHYFEGKIDLPIRWFGQADRQTWRSIKLGAYNLKTQSIKIHRFLNRPEIPAYFVRYVIYHEMLHHVHPPIQGKRRRIHHSTFREKEKAFEQYDEVKKFLVFLQGSCLPRRRRPRKKWWMKLKTDWLPNRFFNPPSRGKRGRVI
jgi:hypothetical protein